MLLQRLVEYANAHCASKPFHREREFTWQLELSSRGRAPELVDLRGPNDRGKITGQRRLAPSVTRTVAIAPQLGADDVQYVLGWGDESTKPERVRQCHTEFVGLVQRWADAVAGRDPVAATVAEFYRSKGVAALEGQHRAEITAKQGVVIAVDGEPITGRESLIRFWVGEVAARKGSGRPGLCLVCGAISPLVDTIPGNITKRLVPGAANNAALVSINERVFGYGLITGLAHTPICFACGDGINVALTALLSGPHVTGLPQQDSAMTWWTLGDPEPDFYAAMPDQADPEAVSRLLRRLHAGALDDSGAGFSADRFCSVTLGGSSSRIMVRDWIDLPLRAVEKNVALWYRDHQIHTRTISEHERARYGLWALVAAAGRWDAERNLYRDLSSTSSGRPKHIYRELLRSSLHRTPIPPTILQHILHRITSDARVDGPRVALIRAALRPRSSQEENPVPDGLDDNHLDTAYLSGRVFALYERLQYVASKEKDSSGEFKGLNATYTDRYFAGAVANPHPALTAGAKLAKAWLAKLRRRENGKPAAISLERQIAGVHEKIVAAQGFPRRLNPQQQGQFILGYYHQQAHDAAQSRPQRTAEPVQN